MKMASEGDRKCINLIPRKITMRENDESFKELLISAIGVLQLVINIKDSDGRVERLRKIINKLQKEGKEGS
tara:strand:+ start:1792 stop:2004 length:213 start_codon:yes stop_codon:yes gene_type:complete